MLTHQNERPEKCPIATCEYNVKGFARKYDKNRHTLTHYKGTMVCGFCPGSGSAAEKSFNRADVFKRHLTSVHGVEQNPPNSRKKSPSGRKAHCGQPNVAGTCSTCSLTFANAQEFYEHLDDCVLRVVQQADPSEAINQRLLTSVAEDKDVTETLDRNGLSKSIEYTVPSYKDDEEEDEEEEFDNDDQKDDTYGVRRSRSGKGALKSSKQNQHWQLTGGAVSSTTTNKVTKPAHHKGPRSGLTFSKGGVATIGSGRKKRKNYPVSWGCATDKMKMKKRVLCVYDGPRRLWKDDMMLDAEFEVRMALPDGKGYVTDLDVQTMNRSEALLGSSVEERGEWVPDNIVSGGEAWGLWVSIDVFDCAMRCDLSDGKWEQEKIRLHGQENMVDPYTEMPRYHEERPFVVYHFSVGGLYLLARLEVVDWSIPRFPGGPCTWNDLESAHDWMRCHGWRDNVWLRWTLK
jgi:hypothetical protein